MKRYLVISKSVMPPEIPFLCLYVTVHLNSKPKAAAMVSLSLYSRQETVVKLSL